MDGNIIGFFIWGMTGCILIGLGICAFFQKKAVGFRANIKVESVNNIRKYDGAVGKLLIVYGVIFILLGTPLLEGQNSSLILFSILGILVESIIAMAVYNLHIAKKYKTN